MNLEAQASQGSPSLKLKLSCYQVENAMLADESEGWSQLLVPARRAQEGDVLGVLHRTTLLEGQSYLSYRAASDVLVIRGGQPQVEPLSQNDSSPICSRLIEQAHHCATTARICPKRGKYVLMPERFRPRSSLILPGAVLHFLTLDRESMRTEMLSPTGRDGANRPLGTPIGRMEINPAQTSHEKMAQVGFLADLQVDLSRLWTAFVPSECSVEVDELHPLPPRGS
jgi:hypothetical protein